MHTAFGSEERFTQGEFLEWLRGLRASDINRYELMGGRILMTPPAGFSHSALAARIVYALSRYTHATGSGLVLESSAGFNLPSGDTLEPDVTFLSAARLAAGPKPGHGSFLEIVPDLVVEVLSRSTARRDRVEKKKVYARCGVEEYWLVDPRRSTVEIFAREGETFGAARVFRSGALVSRVAPELELSIEELFTGLD
ncbi:MAG: Uma2 family endonuclease [Deltaproteobacteria bacterium]|nr:Uma2 family endonuclease [Deltaproteobacteria bacterium]